MSVEIMEVRIGGFVGDSCYDRKVVVHSLGEARDVWCQHLTDMLYQRDCLGGDIYLNGHVVAVLSPNGRLWVPELGRNEKQPYVPGEYEITQPDGYEALIRSGFIKLQDIPRSLVLSGGFYEKR